MEMVRYRYIAFRCYQNALDIRDLQSAIRQKLIECYGLFGSSSMYAKVVSVRKDIAVIRVYHKDVKKVIAATATMVQPRLVPIKVSGTIRKLNKKINSAEP